MKVFVVDIDNTLVITPRISRLILLLASLLQKIARRLQKVNFKLVRSFDGYERIIILTGRDVANYELTRRQLSLMGGRFDTIICCPMTRLVNAWKISVVRELIAKHQGDVYWIDDEFFRGIPSDLIRSSRLHVVPLRGGVVSQDEGRGP